MHTRWDFDASCTNPKGEYIGQASKIEAQVHYFVTILEHKQIF